MTGWTFRKLIDGNMTVTAYCQKCGHRQRLDLAALAKRLGDDAPATAYDLEPRMYCTVCTCKRISLTYAPDVEKLESDRKPTRSLYARSKGE